MVNTCKNKYFIAKQLFHYSRRIWKTTFVFPPYFCFAVVGICSFCYGRIALPFNGWHSPSKSNEQYSTPELPFPFVLKSMSISFYLSLQSILIPRRHISYSTIAAVSSVPVTVAVLRRIYRITPSSADWWVVVITDALVARAQDLVEEFRGGRLANLRNAVHEHVFH